MSLWKQKMIMIIEKNQSFEWKYQKINVEVIEKPQYLV